MEEGLHSVSEWIRRHAEADGSVKSGGLTFLLTIAMLQEEKEAETRQDLQRERTQVLKLEKELQVQLARVSKLAKELDDAHQNQLTVKTLTDVYDNHRNHLRKKSLQATSNFEKERKELESKVTKLESNANNDMQAYGSLIDRFEESKEIIEGQKEEIDELKNQIHAGTETAALLENSNVCLAQQVEDHIRQRRKDRKRLQQRKLKFSKANRMLQLNLGPEATARRRKTQQRAKTSNAPKILKEQCKKGHEHNEHCTLISHFVDDDSEDEDGSEDRNSTSRGGQNLVTYEVVSGQVPSPIFAEGRFLGSPPANVHLVLPHFAYNPGWAPATRAKRQLQG